MDKFFSLLSPALKAQILFHIYNPILSKISILHNCNSIEKIFIINHLNTTLYLPTDVIARQGEEGECLYFINKGIVEVQIQKYSIIDESSSKRDKVQSPVGSRRINFGSNLKLTSAPELITQLKEGSFFGEVALVTSLKRTATTAAIDFCTLSTLNRSVYLEAKEEYP